MYWLFWIFDVFDAHLPQLRQGFLLFHDYTRKNIVFLVLSRNQGINAYHLNLCRAFSVKDISASYSLFWFLALIYPNSGWFSWFFTDTREFVFGSLWILNQGINIYHFSLGIAFSVRNRCTLYQLFWFFDVFDAHLRQLRPVFLFFLLLYGKNKICLVSSLN